MFSAEECSEKIRSIRSELSKIFIGKENIVDCLLAALFSEGHVLIEGYPGTAKTMLAKAFAKVIGGTFKRIQFTPDTLPTDVTGFYVYTLSGEKIFREGPVFANIVLADELNRTTPRTQAALLEAMQEKQVTIDGVTHKLPWPFMIVATQIPLGVGIGVYPLSEVQVDRFMLRTFSGYNPPEEEVEVVKRIDFIEELPVENIINWREVRWIVEAGKRVHVDENIVRYIINLSTHIRRHPSVSLGPSPRASISLYKASRISALMDGRDYVIPDDVKKFAHPALDHRIRLRAEAEIEGVKPEDIVEEALREVEVPK